MEGKNIKVEDLIDGEYYHADKDKIVFIHDGNKRRDEIGYSYRVQCFNGNGYYSRNGTYGRNGVIESTLRLATNEEKEWLKYAIKINKYISYEDFLKEYKPTYEKGKWYKYRDWYIKFEKDDGEYFQSSEEIDNNRIYRKVNSRFGEISKEKVLLEDLKEIEPYLPKDHPDIQQKPETFVGRYFKALVENAEWSNVIKNNYYEIVKEDEKIFKFYTEKYPDITFSLQKKNTENYELMPIGWTPSDVMPEYVQLFKRGWSVDGEYVGEIFDLSDLSNLSKFKHAPTKSEFLKNINGWIKDGFFKISDKKSYNLQNNSIFPVDLLNKRLAELKPLVPEECYNTEIEVGDEVECVEGIGHPGIGFNLGLKFIVNDIQNYEPEKCYFRENGHGVYENHLKLIKKANKNTTTTLNKKVDVSSPKVTDKITVPKVNTTSYDTLVHINIETNTKSIKIPKLETNTPEIKKIKIQSLTLTI